jgi:hypothetical protein
MNPSQYPWQLTILDADLPESAAMMDSLACGDIDGDGRVEVVIGGLKGLFWYRPETRERGQIFDKHMHVGAALMDIDGDGVLEVIAAYRITPDGGPEEWCTAWFDSQGKDLYAPWSSYVIDPHTIGAAHDTVVFDVDGDGQLELICDEVYCANPGLFVFKPGPDPKQLWHKHVVQRGFVGEGTVAGDVDGDGLVEIISGPHLWHQPAAGPYSGPWTCTTIAPNFREMCRCALIDINEDGRLDLVIVDSEYPNGRLSWFENTKRGWVEHPLESPVNYGHSLSVWKDDEGTHIFAGEMEIGGWESKHNWQAQLLKFTTTNKGKRWSRETISRGTGIHEAMAFDIDNDGQREIIGKSATNTVVYVWKREPPAPRLSDWTHTFLDRDKSHTATDIFWLDVDGDGIQDVVCGEWWYRAPDWQRYAIPGIYQAHMAYDIDGDGRAEIIATTKSEGATDWYGGLSCNLVWLKAIDPRNSVWEAHEIGVGSGDWPHGLAIGPLLPGGKLAMIAGYHNSDEGARPEIFAIPDDPRSPWPASRLADIEYGEEFNLVDLTGNGLLDIFAGEHWLENNGDGTFTPHRIYDKYKYLCRTRVLDIDGDGKLDMIAVVEWADWAKRQAGFMPVIWFKQPDDPRGPWQGTIIDKIRSPHSIDVADLDGDGELEVVVGEHDPFAPYRASPRLYAYKKADPAGRAWKRWTIDDRFEHHDGAKICEIAPGRFAIASHGWMDSLYVHVWGQRGS